MISRRTLAILVTAGCVLPLSIAILLGVGRLLAAMQDDGGAAALDRIALGLGILWAIDLACLLIGLGINASGRGDDPPQSRS